MYFKSLTAMAGIISLVFLLISMQNVHAYDQNDMDNFPYDRLTLDLYWDGWSEIPDGMDMTEWKNRGFRVSWVYPFKSEGPGWSFATGLSIANHNYYSDVFLWHFSGENKISENQIIPDTTDSYRNKLSNTYFELPLEFQYLPRRSSLYSFTWGMRAGWLLRSRSVYRASGTSVSVKTRDNRTPYRFNTYLRISRGSFGIYGEVSLTPLFDHDNSPDIYTYSLGIAVTFW